MDLLAQVVPAIKETDRLWDSLEAFEKNPIPIPLNAYHSQINDYLGEEVGGGADRRSFIKFGLLLGDKASNTGKYLRLNRKTVQFMECLISGSTKLKDIIPQLTQKQIIRFLRTYMSDWWGIQLYATVLYPIDHGGP